MTEKRAWDKMVLIGFRGSGKSNVGRLLAQRLGFDFIDLDEYIENKEGQTIMEIVKRHGWGYFRARERECLKEVSEFKEVVLALGGGAVLHEDLLEELKRGALVVYLQASVDTLVKRIRSDEKSRDSRPSLTDLSLEEEVKSVLEERAPLYEKFAHLRINTNALRPEDVLEEIMSSIELSKG